MPDNFRDYTEAFARALAAGVLTAWGPLNLIIGG